MENLNHFFEELLNEASKERFIKKIPNLTDEEIQEYTEFFNTHNDAASSINWQKKDLSKDDLDTVINDVKEKALQKSKEHDKFRLGTTSAGAIKMFEQHKDDLEIIHENEKFLFIKVLTYEGAKFCDSTECGGEGAKWCIGYEKSNHYWKYYTNDKKRTFIMAYNLQHDISKPDTLKYMLELGSDEAQAWLQSDQPSEVLKSNKFESVFGIKCDSKDTEDIIQKQNGYITFLGHGSQEITITIGKFVYISVPRVNYSIDKYVVPEGIESIGTDAFEKIQAESIILPKSLKVLEKSSINIKGNELIIPENVEYIDYSFIYASTNLKKIIFEGNKFIFKDLTNSSSSHNLKLSFTNVDIVFKKPHPKYFMQNGIFIEKNNDELNILYIQPFNDSDTIIIPEGITTITSNNFMFANNKIILPKSLRRIEKQAFYGAKMEELIIPENVTEISCLAFNASQIEKIIFKGDKFNFYKEKGYHDSNPKLINPFIKYNNTDKVYPIFEKPNKYYIKDDFLLFNEKNITYLLCDLTKSTTCNIPEGVHIICSSAITSNKKSINLPKSCKVLASEAIKGYAKCGNLNLNEGLLYIGRDSLPLINILEVPSTVKKIYEENYRYSLKIVLLKNSNLELPNDIKEKESENELQVITNIQDVKHIDGLFYTNNNLIMCDTKVKGPMIIPYGITTIKSQAFKSCINITSLIIPDTVNKIENWAFSSCTKLDTISLPNNSLTTYKQSPFTGCKRLKTVNFGLFKDNILPSELFAYTGLENITIPDNIISLGSNAFAGCKLLRNITLPRSLVSINSSVFSKCISLTQINYLGTKAEWLSLRKNIKNIQSSNKAILNCTISCLDGDIPGNISKL